MNKIFDLTLRLDDKLLFGSCGGNRMTRSTFSHRVQLLSILFLSIVSINACTNHGQGSTPQPLVHSSHLSVLSIRAIWPQALVMAQGWKADAYVREVAVDVPLPTRSSPDPQGYPGANFYFQSPSEDDVTFVVRCASDECSSFEIEQNPGYSLAPCLPITMDDFTLDSQDAIEIGLQHGGEEYINRQTTSVVLKLLRVSPPCTGTVEWYISFIEVAASEGADVFIDAATGEVIEVRE